MNMFKTNDFTGFHAYWVYVTLKNIHFGSKKFDITVNRLPKKEQFLKSWNGGRKDRDGMMFYKIMENLPADKATYIRCFAAYYMKNPDFHVSEVVMDNFQVFKANELELHSPLATVKSDYLTAILQCHERDITPQTMFYGDEWRGLSGGLPWIYRLYDQRKISANSLIVFDEIFNISNRLYLNETLDIVAENKIIGYRKLFDKYRPLVYTYFEDRDWKSLLQDYHHQIMQSGPNA